MNVDLLTYVAGPSGVHVCRSVIGTGGVCVGVSTQLVAIRSDLLTCSVVGDA